MKPIFAILNHYRPKVDVEMEVDLYHGRGFNKGRENGRILLKSCLDSLKESAEFEYDVVIVDNASSNLVDNIDIPLNYNYIYNDDDEFGVTRGWNLCASFSYMNGNDFIVVCNDDIIFNKSINNFFVDVNRIEDVFTDLKLEDILFGVTSPGGTNQHSSDYYKPNSFYDITNGPHPVSGGLHVWFMGFSRLYYEKYQVKGKLFDVEDIYPWGSNEQFQNEHRSRGSKQIIIGSTMVEHGFGGSWRHRREVCEIK